uniref:Vesicle-associated membrane protein 7 n=1 Tax=Macrostomum lignano TaxID=282301 RepID=A0A1I8IDA0_9PLAT
MSLLNPGYHYDGDDGSSEAGAGGGLLFAAVARGTTILAKQALAAGNFVEVTEQVLARITPENAKMSLSQGAYMFHYASEDRLVYFCVTPDTFERSRAFLFLADVKQRFVQRYGRRALTALPYAMNSEFAHTLAQLMTRYSALGAGPATASDSVGGGQNRPSIERTEQMDRVQQQVSELQGIMVRNIDSLATRGERIELLVDKADELAGSSIQFSSASRRVARRYWWRNAKVTIALVIAVILILYFIVSAACGGLDWPCTRKK